MQALHNKKVAVFGIGGVGAACVEGLARAGIGSLVLVDDDLICMTNLNRQLHATTETIGTPKVEAMRDRVLSIDPGISVEIFRRFLQPECADELVRPDYDYVIDAVDTVTAKIALIVAARAKDIPVISCMGAGNKLDPTAFEVAELKHTSVCPLARVMRRELKARGIDFLKVVYSREPPMVPRFTEATDCHFNCVCPAGTQRTCMTRRQIPGSVSFVPTVAGFILAGEVVKDLAGSHFRKQLPFEKEA